MIADLSSLAGRFRGSPMLGGDGNDVPPGEGWAEATDKLLDIRNLKDDWDGLGAPAPAPKVTDGALFLAGWMKGQDIPPPGRIVPSLDGTIVFQWRSDETGRAKMEIEVTAPFEAEMTLFKDGKVVSQESLT